MKRTILVLLCLAAFTLFLTSCQGQQQQPQYTEVTQYIGPAATKAPATTAPPATETPADTTEADTGNEYTETDVLTEEENSLLNAAGTFDFDPGYAAQTSLFSSNTQNDANATAYPYTGSSPIPLAPIDAPTHAAGAAQLHLYYAAQAPLPSA